MARFGNESPHKEVAPVVAGEIATLENRYERGDILGVPAHCLLGIEVDFEIYMDGPTHGQQEALESSRASMRTELSLLVPTTEEQARTKEAWLAQVLELTPPELINYQIYRRLSVPTLESPTTAMYFSADDSPETTLEFCFGNGLFQTGYYDNPGLFEMRTQAAKPSIAMERYNRAVRTAQEITKSFGACFAYRGDQTNFSVWVPGEDGLRPAHDLNDSHGREISRRATAGMLHAMRDSIVMLCPPYSRSLPEDKQYQLSAAPERGASLRVVPDRFEQRQKLPRALHELSTLVLMSGFAHGVTNEDVDTTFITIVPELLLKPGPGFNKVRDLHLLRALQNSEIIGSQFNFNYDTSYERTELMVSSVVGAEVHAGGRAKELLSDLIGCITLGSEGMLEVDEAAFEDTLSRYSGYRMVDIAENPTATISQRLQRLQYCTDVPTISGSLDFTLPSAVTMHYGLRKAVDSASLESISRSTLEVVATTQADMFSYEEAVYKFYEVQVIEQAKLSLPEKLTMIGKMRKQFPEVDQDAIMDRIKNEIARCADGFGEAAERCQKHIDLGKDSGGRMVFNRDEFLKNQRERLALLDALNKLSYTKM